MIVGDNRTIVEAGANFRLAVFVAGQRSRELAHLFGRQRERSIRVVFLCAHANNLSERRQFAVSDMRCFKRGNNSEDDKNFFQSGNLR